MRLKPPSCSLTGHDHISFVEKKASKKRKPKSVKVDDPSSKQIKQKSNKKAAKDVDTDKGVTLV